MNRSGSIPTSSRSANRSSADRLGTAAACSSRGRSTTSSPSHSTGSRCRGPTSPVTGPAWRSSPRSWLPPIRSTSTSSAGWSTSTISLRSGRSKRSSTSGTATPPIKTTTSPMPPPPTGCSASSPGGRMPRSDRPPASVGRSRDGARHPRSPPRRLCPTASTSPRGWPTATATGSRPSSPRCGRRKSCSPKSIASSVSSRPSSDRDRPAPRKRWSRCAISSAGVVGS